MWFCFPPLFQVTEHEFLVSVLNWAPNNWLNSLNFLVIVLLGWINFQMLVSQLLISLGLLPSLSLEKRLSLFIYFLQEVSCLPVLSAPSLLCTLCWKVCCLLKLTSASLSNQPLLLWLTFHICYTVLKHPKEEGKKKPRVNATEDVMSALTLATRLLSSL